MQLAVIPPLPNPEPPLLQVGEKPRKRKTIGEWKAEQCRRFGFERIELVRRECLGPVGLIGNPRVVIGYNRSSTGVWIARRPWGWSDGHRVYVNDNHVPSAVAYAMELADGIRRIAKREEEYRSQHKTRCLNGVKILLEIELEGARNRKDTRTEQSLLERLSARERLRDALFGNDGDAPTYEDDGNGRLSIGYGCTWVKPHRELR